MRGPAPRPKEGDQRLQIRLAPHPRPGIEAAAARPPIRHCAARTPLAVVTIAVEKAGSTLDLPPERERKRTSSKASISSSPIWKCTKPSRSTCGSAQAKTSAVPRRAAASAAAAIRGQCPPASLRLQHEAREIMLLPRPDSRAARPSPPPPRAVAPASPGRHPVIILELQHIEGGRGPAERHIGPLHLRAVQHRRQIDEQQALRLRRLRPHRVAQGRRRGRQHRRRPRRASPAAPRRASPARPGSTPARRPPPPRRRRGRCGRPPSPTTRARRPGTAPAAPPPTASAAKACATACSQSIAASLAGDSKAEGGSQPVSAGSPFSARCFHASGQCWSSNS